MRPRMNRRARWVALLLAAALVAPVWAAAPVPGQHLPALHLKDQHDREWYVRADTRLVIFAAGRKASNLAMAVLGQQAKGFLATRHAVYLADMSKMPGFITRSFALPSLKEQPFEVGVVLDDKTLEGWPRQDDALTLIRLDNGRVVGHEYATTEAQLRAALGL